MATALSFTVKDAKAKAKLDALVKSGNLEKVHDAVGSVITNRVRLCFKLGQDPWGVPWQKIKFRAPRRTNDRKRLSRTGRQQRAANMGGAAGQPLRDTGALQRSITYKADPGGVTIGTNQMPRAAVHQFGVVIAPKKAKRLVFPGPTGAMIFAKKVTIPRRSFLPQRGPNVPPALPPAWSVAVVRAIKTRLLSIASKV